MLCLLWGGFKSGPTINRNQRGAWCKKKGRVRGARRSRLGYEGLAGNHLLRWLGREAYPLHLFKIILIKNDFQKTVS